jgi:hypothetical protein
MKAFRVSGIWFVDSSVQSEVSSYKGGQINTDSFTLPILIWPMLDACVRSSGASTFDHLRLEYQGTQLHSTQLTKDVWKNSMEWKPHEARRKKKAKVIWVA